LRHRRDGKRKLEDQDKDCREKLTTGGGSVLDADPGSILKAD